MKWHVEPWVKAYRTKTPEWLRLPVSARGLGRELLTYADEDDGAIAVGDGPVGLEIAYLLGARPREHKRIVEDVAELLKDGYLIAGPGRVLIRNFMEAQDRTPGAKRTAQWRERKTAEYVAKKRGNAAKNGHGNVTGKSPGDVADTSHVTSPETSRVTSHVQVPVTGSVTQTYARRGVEVEAERDPDLISENSVLLSPPAGPTGPQPQEVDGPKEIRKQPPGLGQQVLAELKLHPSLEPIATRDFAKAVGAHLMTAGKPMPWVLDAIRDVAVVVAGQGLSAEALAKKTFSFIKNARRPRDPEATANDTRPVDAPTAREALPTWVTNPKVEREATEDELRATALEAHAQGMPVPPALRQYLPTEVA